MPDERTFGRRVDGPTGRRRSDRERMNLAVALYAIDQSRVALLVDVSATGCRLQGYGLPELGQDVLLNAPDVELFGRIVWKGDAERGIQFDQPISETDFEKLRDALARQLGKDRCLQPGFRLKAVGGREPRMNSGRGEMPSSRTGEYLPRTVGHEAKWL